MPLGREVNIYDQANHSDSMLSPHVGYAHNIQPLAPAINSSVSALPYKELQLGNSNSWDSYTNLISMFSQTASQEIDIYNIKVLLSCISDFISNRELKNNREEDIPFLKGFSQITFNFISTIFKSRWDQLRMDINNKTF